jgi:hypothetical protein
VKNELQVDGWYVVVQIRVSFPFLSIRFPTVVHKKKKKTQEITAKEGLT